MASELAKCEMLGLTSGAKVLNKVVLGGVVAAVFFCT